MECEMKPASGIIPLITLDDDDTEQHEGSRGISETKKPQKRCAEVILRAAKKPRLDVDEARTNNESTGTSTQPQKNGELMSFTNLKCCFECEKKLDIDQSKRLKLREAGEIVAVAVEFVSICNESCLELLKKHKKSVTSPTDILHQFIKNCRKLKKLQETFSTDVKHGLLFAVAMCDENVENISRELIAEDVCELMFYLTCDGTRDEQKAPETSTEQWMQLALEAVDIARYHSYLNSYGWKMKMLEQEINDKNLSGCNSMIPSQNLYNKVDDVKAVDLEDEIQVFDGDKRVKVTSTPVISVDDAITVIDNGAVNGAKCIAADNPHAANCVPAAIKVTSTKESSGTLNATTSHTNNVVVTMINARRAAETAHQFLQTRLTNNLVMLQVAFAKSCTTRAANNIKPVQFPVPGHSINAGSSLACVSNKNNFNLFTFGSTNPFSQYLNVCRSSSAPDNSNFGNSSLVQNTATTNRTNSVLRPLDVGQNSTGFFGPLYTDFSDPSENTRLGKSECLQIKIGKDSKRTVAMSRDPPAKPKVKMFKKNQNKTLQNKPSVVLTTSTAQVPNIPASIPGLWAPMDQPVQHPQNLPAATSKIKTVQPASVGSGILTVDKIKTVKPSSYGRVILDADKIKLVKPASVQSVSPAADITKSVKSASSGTVDSPIVIDEPEETTRSVTSFSAPVLLNCNVQINTTAVPRPLTGSSTLRPIAIDGSNVAFSHGKNVRFSCRGIELCVDHFFRRGHPVVKVFVPHFRSTSLSNESSVIDRDILHRLERKQIVVFTPSRKIDGRLVVCYDDRFLLEYASQSGAVVVSNDNFRDLIHEPRFVDIIKYRLLMYAFADDVFMIPDDPLGKFGPRIDKYLSW